MFRGTKSEARNYRHLLLAAGPTSDPVPADIRTVHGFAAEWFRAGAPHWTPATISSRDTAYRLRIGPKWGNTNLTDVTRPAIEAWVADLLRRRHGRRAVEIAVETLRAMFTVARRAELVAVNPAERVRFPDSPPPERTPSDRIVDHDDFALMIAACRSVRHETIIRAALEAGLRRGEIVALTWPDVLLQEHRIVVRGAVWQDANVGKIERRPKMAHVARVAISTTFAERLAAWHHEAVIVKGHDANGPVWPGRDGWMSPSSVTHLIANLAKRAGIVDHHGRNRVHLHGLRHSGGSIALSRGVPITIVSAQLRHSRPDFTMRTYAHLLGEHELDRYAKAQEQEAGDGQTPPAAVRPTLKRRPRD